jgi:hypothetical protein
VTYEGQKMPLNAAARKAGVHAGTLDYHVRVLWRTVDEAVALIRSGTLKAGRPRKPSSRRARRERRLDALRSAGELPEGLSPNFRRDRRLLRRADELLAMAIRRPAPTAIAR